MPISSLLHAPAVAAAAAAAADAAAAAASAAPDASSGCRLPAAQPSCPPRQVYQCLPIMTALPHVPIHMRIMDCAKQQQQQHVHTFALPDALLTTASAAFIYIYTFGTTILMRNATDQSISNHTMPISSLLHAPAVAAAAAADAAAAAATAAPDASSGCRLPAAQPSCPPR
nr:unnamed protein product [Spirometra erinaceieuropaei]